MSFAFSSPAAAAAVVAQRGRCTFANLNVAMVNWLALGQPVEASGFQDWCDEPSAGQRAMIGNVLADVDALAHRQPEGWRGGRSIHSNALFADAERAPPLLRLHGKLPNPKP